MLLEETDRRLIDGWQRDFPITPAPFAEIAAALGIAESDVLARLARLSRSGALSRIGAVVRPNTVGASTLAAISAPGDRIESAAAAIVEEPGVNHAYEREHAYNLWFVVTAPDAAGVAAAIARIEHRVGARALVLPMLRDFHIDLGFRLFDAAPEPRHRRRHEAVVVDDDDRRLLCAIENGIDLVARPFQSVAVRIGWREADVCARLTALISSGVVTRFGLVVRHRHFGYSANAMVVWDIPDNRLEETALDFAQRDCVTLCYERPRVEGVWRYNLFTMIHGRERAAALAQIEDMSLTAPAARDLAVLFSRRCFRQCGARLSAA
ncbi:MAG: AsnC family transcriptional regulator [Methylobacteriaceae bacterium]|nr:AsnC family transcriptional regulator [Methylobacteriaceae bacterium]